MKLFIDTANIEEIKTASTWGILSGVTTNPSLIAKEGKKLVDVISQIVTLVDGPISAEVKEDTVDAMFEEALHYARMHSNIVIKVPMTFDGLTLTRRLSDLNIKTNVTLVFSVSQAMMAAKAGATYVSPFMGRLDDLENSDTAGATLLEDVRYAFDLYGIKTEIIAASIRHKIHAEQAMLAGADIATIPYKVFLEMVKHELTDKGLAIFKKASE